MRSQIDDSKFLRISVVVLIMTLVLSSLGIAQDKKAMEDIQKMSYYEDYRAKPDGKYAIYDYSNLYVKTIYYIKNGMRQKEKRFNRIGKVLAEIHYKNDIQIKVEQFYDIETFFLDVWDSMDSSSWGIAFLLLTSIIGLIMIKTFVGLGFLTTVYLVFCTVVAEAFFNLLLKSIGYTSISSLFRHLSFWQLLFILFAILFLLVGIWEVFHKKRQALIKIFIGVLLTSAASICSLISQYNHWGLSYVFVSHFKLFLFVSLFSFALMFKTLFMKYNQKLLFGTD